MISMVLILEVNFPTISLWDYLLIRLVIIVYYQKETNPKDDINKPYTVGYVN